jgi:hypothetical protein
MIGLRRKTVFEAAHQSDAASLHHHALQREQAQWTALTRSFGSLELSFRGALLSSLKVEDGRDMPWPDGWPRCEDLKRRTGSRFALVQRCERTAKDHTELTFGPTVMRSPATTRYAIVLVLAHDR